MEPRSITLTTEYKQGPESVNGSLYFRMEGPFTEIQEMERAIREWLSLNQPSSSTF